MISRIFTRVIRIVGFVKRNGGRILKIIMWTIAGVMAAVTIAASVIMFMMFLHGARAGAGLGLLAGCAVLIAGGIVTFTFLTVWRCAEDWISDYLMVKDYRDRRDKTGE